MAVEEVVPFPLVDCLVATMQVIRQRLRLRLPHDVDADRNSDDALLGFVDVRDEFLPGHAPARVALRLVRTRWSGAVRLLGAVYSQLSRLGDAFLRPTGMVLAQPRLDLAEDRLPVPTLGIHLRNLIFEMRGGLPGGWWSRVGSLGSW